MSAVDAMLLAPLENKSLNENHEFFLIGELARAVGLEPKTIRFYEREGLVKPLRQGKFRVFSRKDANVLAAVKRLRVFGTPISEIRAILDEATIKENCELRIDFKPLLSQRLAALELAQTQGQERIAELKVLLKAA